MRERAHSTLAVTSKRLHSTSANVQQRRKGAAILQQTIPICRRVLQRALEEAQAREVVCHEAQDALLSVGRPVHL